MAKLTSKELHRGTNVAALSAALTDWRSIVSDYVVLTKPRIISLLLLTTLTAMLIATGKLPPLELAFATLLAGGMMAGAANALNCYLDRVMDLRMSRTRNRPIPARRIAPTNALIFSLTLATSAFLLFTLAVNLLSALLSFAGFLIYILVYTLWLKRTSPSAVFFGGIAGAVPPLVGWAAATGQVDLHAFELFAIVAIWQVPHTWALSLMLQNDYARAKVPVLPVVAGPDETRKQILLYTVLLALFTFLPYTTGLLDLGYFVPTVILGAEFIALAGKLYRAPDRRLTVQLYKYSLIYLALLFITMAVGRLWPL